MVDPPSDSPEILRLAFVSGGWPPEHIATGIATYLRNIRAGLHRFGADSRILAIDVPPGYSNDEVRIAIRAAELPWPQSLFERALLRMRSSDKLRQEIGRSLGRAAKDLCQTWPISLIEAEEAFGFASVLRSRSRLPTVVRLHGPWFLVAQANGESSSPNADQRIEREGWAICSADAVSAPTREVLSRTLSHYGVELPHAAVIPNPGPDVPESQRWLPAGCDRDCILFVGRFDRLKGGDLIIDAFARLAKTFSRLRLIFVGPDHGLSDGGPGAVNIDDYIGSSVADPEIRKRIQYLGHQKFGDIAALRRRAALTVVASRYETMPMTVLEAMAHGSPLVATDVGGIREMTNEGEFAVLSKPGDATALAKAIEEVYTHPEAAAALGAAGRHHHLTNLSPEVVARRSIEFYRGVVDRHRLSRPRAKMRS
jgi:glycosyltransferase involved in cell wall biosynthesis